MAAMMELQEATMFMRCFDFSHRVWAFTTRRQLGSAFHLLFWNAIYDWHRSTKLDGLGDLFSVGKARGGFAMTRAYDTLADDGQQHTQTVAEKCHVFTVTQDV